MDGEMSGSLTGSRHGPIAPMSSQAELAPGPPLIAKTDGAFGRVGAIQPIGGVGDVGERGAAAGVAQADRAGGPP